MSHMISQQAENLAERFGEKLSSISETIGQITIEVQAAHWQEVARALRDEPELSYEQLTDLCGLDYLGYGDVEWATSEASNEGFSRAVEAYGTGRFKWREQPAAEDIEQRFAVVVHLLSYRHNRRLRMRCFAPDEGMPIVPSLVEIWSSANWYERETFDLVGIVFEGHPDLRRLMTDYGFIGHPFRKDFPLIGNVSVRYDQEKGRVAYEPVEIEPRVLVPRVIRNDARYRADEIDRAADDAAEKQASEDSNDG